MSKFMDRSYVHCSFCDLCCQRIFVAGRSGLKYFNRNFLKVLMIFSFANMTSMPSNGSKDTVILQNED